MIKDGETTRVKACYPPDRIPLANTIYSILRDNWESAANFTSGMSINLHGLDKNYLAEYAEKYKGIDLTLYEPYINLFEYKLKKQFRNSKKDK